MEFTSYVRKPFVVEAVEITTENIAELSELIGTLRSKDDGTPYIQANKRLVPNAGRVYPGFWATKFGENINCYSRRQFEKQFAFLTPEIRDWVDFINGDAPSFGPDEVSSSVIG